MKVACVGNMNNMLFSLTRYLRDRGVEADLFLLNNELPQFKQEYDSYDSDYLDYTIQLNWGDMDSWRTIDKKELQETFHPYGFIIATGSLSFFHRADINVDVFFPHGSDILELPFLGEKQRLDQRIRTPHFYQFYRAHRKGILEAACINQERYTPRFRGPLEKLKVYHKTYYFGCPMVYQGIYGKDVITNYFEHSKYFQLFHDIRKETELMIMNQTRQLWVTHDEIGHLSKGSDKLIRGFSKFVNTFPHIRSKLLLCEYGRDVSHSKRLIENLGIADYIQWLPFMPRKELMIGVHLADFSCGEFFPGNIGGGTTWEALATGTCLIHYLDTGKIKFESFSEPYPFVNAKEPGEIFSVFKDFIKNPTYYKDLATKAFHWYKKNFSESCIDHWLELIQIKENGQNLGKFVIDKVSQIHH